MDKKFKKSFLVFSFAVWVVCCLALVIPLQARHLISFWPNKNLAVIEENKKWSLTHILGEGCKCSETVGAYLLERGPQKDLNEAIIYLGKDKQMIEKYVQRGFKVDIKDPESIRADQATGVPYLIIATGKTDIIYAGGYSAKKIIKGSPIEDLTILSSLRGGRAPANFPIFGCAMSAKFKSLIDPLQIKSDATQDKSGVKL